MLPAEGGEHFCRKARKNTKKKVFRTDMVHEKEQTAGLIRKLRAVVHAVVFAAGLLDAESAQGPSQSKISDGPMVRNNGFERTTEP